MDISVDLTAPLAGGNYTGFWKLRNAVNEVFELSDDDSMVDLNGSFEDIQRLLLECIPYTDRTEVEKRMPKYKEW